MIFTFIETKYNIATYFLQKNSYLFDLLSTMAKNRRCFCFW